MPRIGDVLDRESRTVDLERGDFERLLARRERKQRNRRIRAGVVGVIVALIVGVFLARSLISDGVPADRPVPTPPAASGALAYTLDGDVYVADPDGSNAVKIADGRSAADCHGGEYSAEGGLWSPDGRYLAYQHQDCANNDSQDVVISDPQGTVVAEFPAQGWHIDWSPDSTRVAVWDSFGETIGVYGLDGSRQTQLTIPTGFEMQGDWDPFWPNGDSLQVGDLVLPLDGGQPRPPRNGRDLSPDRSRVVDNDGRTLTVARADGSKPQVVSGEWARVEYVTWSPTGEQIAFATSSPGSPWSWRALRIIDAATGSVTLLVEAERGTPLSIIGFSPQGDRLLYAMGDGEGAATGLWSVGVDGSDARLLVSGTTEGELRPR
jgi:Tol biopolymer transport system component